MYRLSQDFYYNCFFHLTSILSLSDKQRDLFVHRKGKWTLGKCKINTKGTRFSLLSKWLRLLCYSPLDSFHNCTSCLWSSLHFKKIHLVIKSSLQTTAILILMYDFILLIKYRSFLGAICVSIQYNQIWRGGVFRCIKARNVSVGSESEHSGTWCISDQHESALPRWKKLQS